MRAVSVNRPGFFPSLGRGVGLGVELGPGDFYFGSAEAALHSEKDPYGNACSSRLFPMRFGSQYSISEDTLHQPRWGREEALGPGPFHPSWFSQLDLAPSASSRHLRTPLCLRLPAFW